MRQIKTETFTIICPEGKPPVVYTEYTPGSPEVSEPEFYADSLVEELSERILAQEDQIAQLEKQLAEAAPDTERPRLSTPKGYSEDRGLEPGESMADVMKDGRRWG